MKQAQWRQSPIALAVAAVAASFCITPTAHAFKFDTGNPDLKMRWDNTLKYSAGFRLEGPSDDLTNNPNYDDGNRNFDKGLISNRIDWLTEFDVRYKNVGARLSGAAWYDAVYNQSNDNDSPATNNGTKQDYDEFPDETRNLHGRRAELLDAFVFGNFNLGSMRANVRLGQHSLVYGETLFFGANGIADAQGPIDLVKLLTVPSSQFKEVLRPVPQVSGTLQIKPGLSLGAYYQFRWEKTLIPGVGSYLSNIDWAGDGTQSLLLPPALGGPIYKAHDINPKDSGQGGLQLRWSPEGSDWEYGFYAARYHAKTPTTFNFDFFDGALETVYAQGIRTFGASATTSIGQLNLAGEVSVRHNAPLNGDPRVVAPLFVPGSNGTASDNDKNILYPVGKTAHANLSGIYVLQPNAVWEGGSFLFELAWNRVLSITKNKAALDPNTTRDAWATRMIFSPAYFQVLPGLDIEVPIGLGYNFAGRSGAVANLNGGASYGGDFSLGLTGTYQNVWKFGLNYVHWLGDEDNFVTPANVLSFKQTRKDRNFISFNIQRTF